jgi:hypothetical protein
LALIVRSGPAIRAEVLDADIVRRPDDKAATAVVRAGVDLRDVPENLTLPSPLRQNLRIV